MIFLFSGFGPAFSTNLEPFARAVKGYLVLLLQGGEGWEQYLDDYLVPFRAAGLEVRVVVPSDSELDAAALDTLAGAGGVFIGGGQTEVYHRLYATGPTAESIRRLHHEGVPVAGLETDALVIVDRGQPTFSGPGAVFLIEGRLDGRPEVRVTRIHPSLGGPGLPENLPTW